MAGLYSVALDTHDRERAIAKAELPQRLADREAFLREQDKQLEYASWAHLLSWPRMMCEHLKM